MYPNNNDVAKYPDKETRRQQGAINEFWDCYVDNLEQEQLDQPFKLGDVEITVMEAVNFVAHHQELQEMKNCQYCKAIVGVTCPYCIEQLKHDTEIMYKIISQVKLRFFN